MTRAVQPPTKRLLTRAEAAGYCSISEKAFERECDVRPIDFGGRHLKRWDRFDLDAWIDRRKEGAATLSAGDWLARAGDDSRAG